MKEPTIETLLQRLERLECKCDSLKRLGAVAVLGFAALIIMGQAVSDKMTKVIEAQKFIVRDTNGKMRATLGVENDGTAFLTFTDNDERPRIFLKTPRNGDAGIALYPRAGNGRSQLSDSGIYLVGKDGKERAELALREDEPTLAVFNKEEKPSAVLEILQDGDPKLEFRDRYGTARIVLGLVKGQPVIGFLDAGGKVTWQAPR